jgi:DNA excision repair protein ERCC-4
MRILVDTREQVPFTFAGYDATTEPATLPVGGDYYLPDFEDRVAKDSRVI